MEESETGRKPMENSAQHKAFQGQEEAAGMGGEQDASAYIVLFSDFRTLKDEVEKMRTELSMLFLERDELRFVICRNIETDYMLKFGSMEYKAYEAQCAALRLKRKAELIQAEKNRQKKIVLSGIEETLDREFAAYQKQLDVLIEKMNGALERRKAEILSKSETKELKRLYRIIVKVLHPDMNPNLSKAQMRLFENAVTAYKDGDLHTLRIICEMMENAPLSEQHTDAMARLAREKARLQGLIKAVKDDIAAIKTEFPYTMKAILEDTEKTTQKKQELENILEQYNALILFYKKKIEEMLR